jgi:hypothetical protein
MSRFASVKCFCLVATFLVATTASAQVPFSLDTTFRAQLTHTWNGPVANVQSLFPMDDGRVIISGAFRFPGDPVPPTNSRHGARLFPDGSRDTTFRPYPVMGGRIIPWQDKMYVNTHGPRRLDLDGNTDPTYISMNSGPYVSTFMHGDCHVFPDGRVVVGGRHILSDSIRGFMGDHNFIWFTDQGYLDTTRTHRKGDGLINTIAALPDGKFLVSCGQCTVQDGQPVNKVFRLNMDGSLDHTFQSPIDWGQARTITPLDDGRFLVSGLFKISSIYNDSLHFVRLMPDGALDYSFNNEIEVFRPEYGQLLLPSHTILPNGNIVIHSRFSSIDGHERNGIALLNEDGYLIEDAFINGGCGTFTSNGIIYGGTGGITIAPDGMLYIHGSYQGYDDDPGQFLVSRLYPDDFTMDVSEEQPPPSAHLVIAPNPATGPVSFRFNSSGSGPATLLIRDISGRIVHQAPVQQEHGQYLWDSRSLGAGAYTVELRNGTGLIMPAQKLILEK